MALGITGPVETKVTAAGTAAALSGLAVWALQRFVFHGDVPAEVSDAVQILVPALCAFLGGFLARHTPRSDVEPPVDERGAHALDGRPRDGHDHELPVNLFEPPPR